jgi:hypothetical protein
VAARPPPSPHDRLQGRPAPRRWKADLTIGAYTMFGGI